ncbi:helix-turn-helix protein [Actinokineospora cianjurensis]|uniref:Helix-turn-helix protein n=1 Tax=Actinokineospora cianjurensis TaxID=585224 RepID=A0A421B2E6_9PSEU|nr:helix-turn-helix protein [Actinokineospora cianjurensis]
MATGAAGTIVRALRQANRLTLADLAGRCGYSISALSRMETGRQPLRDVEILRRMVDALGVPAFLFGLVEHRPGTTSTATPVARVGTATPADEGDAMRRRAFLAVAGMAGAAFALPRRADAFASADPATVLTERLGDVLLGPIAPGEPAPLIEVHRSLRTVQEDFLACRYLDLARRLPLVIAAGEATSRESDTPAAHGLLATAYTLASRVLTKLDPSSGLEWIASDRAMRAAAGAEDPLISAEAQRMVASAARRAGHHDRAQTLTLAAADHLTTAGPDPSPAHVAMHGMLYCSASYAAARAGDRDRATELLDDAAATARRLVDDPLRHRALTANIVSHRVSTSYLLGDAGTALRHAASVPIAQIPSVERRARLLVDTALAAAQWDKPADAYRTLLEAERLAPDEVHTRSTVRTLVTELMGVRQQAAMPGLAGFAQRVHATSGN